MATHALGVSELLPELAVGHESGRYTVTESESELAAEHLLNRLASCTTTPPAIRAAALEAGRAALAGLRALPAEFAGRAQSASELESEVSPLARVYPDQASRGGLSPLDRVYGGREAAMMMEHLGHAAAAAATAAEAEAFLGALVPLAATLAPRVAPLIVRSAPGLIRGVSGAARALLSRRELRPLVRMIPSIVRATAAQLARHSAAAAAGRAPQVTPRGAVRTLARHTVRVLGNPSICGQLWRRSRALDRLYHRANPIAPYAAALSRCADCGRINARSCPCGCGAARRLRCSCPGRRQ